VWTKPECRKRPWGQAGDNSHVHQSVRCVRAWSCPRLVLTHSTFAHTPPRWRCCGPRTPAAQQQHISSRPRADPGSRPTHTKRNRGRSAAYQRARTVENLGARVGKVLAKCKMGKFIRWSIDADQEKPISRQHRLISSIEDTKVAEEKRLDGCYIVSSDVDQR